MNNLTDLQKVALNKALEIALDEDNPTCFDREKLFSLGNSIKLNQEFTNKEIELLIDLIDWNIEMVNVFLEIESFSNYYSFNSKEELKEFRKMLESIKE